MDVKGILAEVERAGHLKLSVSAFTGEFGPSMSGKTLCGFEFASTNACFICGEASVGSFRQANRVKLTPCQVDRNLRQLDGQD